MKSISIALCSCNGEKYITEQLQSIVNQTLLPNEIVVCDDASTDGTLEIINTFAQKYSTIHWIVESHVRRIGVRRNFEQAILLTSGDLIATSDQDDVWELNKLEMLSDMIREKKVALIHTDYLLVDSNGISLNIESRKCPTMSLESYILKDNNVTGCTCMFDSVLKKYLFPFPYNFYFHDRWLAIIAYNNGGIFFCEEPLIRYRQHSCNLVASIGGGGKTVKVSIKYFRKKAEDIRLLLKKRNEIKYSFLVFMLLLKQYITCYLPLAWIKMRNRTTI